MSDDTSGGGSLGGAWVDIRADDSKLDADLAGAKAATYAFAKDASAAATITAKLNLDANGLPKTIQAIQAEMARVRLSMKGYAFSDGGKSEIDPGDLAAKLAPLQAKLDQVTASLKQKAEALARVAERTRLAAAESARLTAAETTTSTAFQAGMGKVQTSSMNAGRSVLLLSQGVEDAQYGFSAIVNNIPNLVMSLGGSAGIAGAVSMVAVGLNVMMQHWSKIEALWGGNGTLTEAKAMEELGKQTEKTVAEVAKLEKYRRNQENQKSQGELTKAQKEQQEAVNEAVVEAGHDAVVRGMVQTRGARYETTDPETIKAKKDLDKAKYDLSELIRHKKGGVDEKELDYLVPEFEKEIAKKQAALEAALHSAVKQDLAASALDPDKLKGLIDHIMANKGAFGPNVNELLRGLMGAHPDEAKGRAAGDAHVARQEREAAERKRKTVQTDEQKRDEAALKKRIESAQEGTRKEADAAAKGLEKTLGSDMLRQLAGNGGNGEVDIDAATAKAHKALVASGKTEAEASMLAGLVVDTLLLAVKAKVEARALAEGVDVAEATRREDDKAKDEAKRGSKNVARAAKPKDEKAEFVGLAEFSKKIMAGTLDRDKHAARSAKANERTATAVETIAQKMKNGPPTAVAVGPA